MISTRFADRYVKIARFCLLMLMGGLLSLVGWGMAPGIGQTMPSRNTATTLNTASLSVVAQASTPLPPQADSGWAYYQAGHYEQAIQVWRAALSETRPAQERLILHTNLAKAYQQLGKPEQAIAQWEQVLALTNQTNPNSPHQRALVLAEQAQAYSQLGQHRRAIDLLTIAAQAPITDPQTIAAIQGGLGNAHWALGDYTAALAAYQLSLQNARQSGNAGTLTTALTNVGNLYARQSSRYVEQAIAANAEGEREEATQLTRQAEEHRKAALAAYQESLMLTRSPATEISTLLNLNYLLKQAATPDWQAIRQQHDRILGLLASQPDSRDKAYALIYLAAYPLPDSDPVQQQQWLAQAQTIAQALGDRRAESFALGTWARMLETSNPMLAMTLTQEALLAAQAINAPDSLYRWQWQMGRLLRAQGEADRAIVAYEQSVATLQSIRSDILATNRDLQFNFRDAVEPVYRELVDLLLNRGQNYGQISAKQSNPDSAKPNGSQKIDIQKALDVLELLKLAELANFFGDECVEVAQAQSTATTIPADTLVVYSVILEKHTDLILRLPDGSLVNQEVMLGASEITQIVSRLRTLLEKRTTEEYLPEAQRLYDLLVRPLEPALQRVQPKTLVFIQDGVLRKIPMAALHDGSEFLIQKVAIATAPSLSLVNLGKTDSLNLNALILGLTVARPPFAALTNVSKESQQVQSILGGTVLLNQDFTLARLEQELQQSTYPIIHLATHGKFGVDNDSTFLLGYDQRITIDQLDSLLRKRRKRAPVELLTLSACQTATGDNRSALGIAGVAVRAGVRSAIATLWAINDESTVPLIETFYRQLRQPGVSKAEALRTAQLAMLSDLDLSHPAVWSPFILIGNWL